MFRIDKETIEKNFSKCAEFYDRHANVQSFAAGQLIELTPERGVKDILEIGCGTANYTILLKERFKRARIKAIDISAGMVDVARRKPKTHGVEFVVADAESVDLFGRFDLITSNASFQWFEDLGSSIARYREALSEEGVIAFSVFGPSTFSELGRVLKRVRGEKAAIEPDNFLDKGELEKLLKKNFRESAVKEVTVKEGYASLMDLLNNIKNTGARGGGLGNNLLWKKDMLKRAQVCYEKAFGSIEATYQIFFCKAIA